MNIYTTAKSAYLEDVDEDVTMLDMFAKRLEQFPNPLWLEHVPKCQIVVEVIFNLP